MNSNVATPAEDRRRLYAQRMAAAIRYIEANLEGDLRLPVLAARAHSSVFHFHRQFRAHTGIPLARYVRLLRLRRASQQLAFEPGCSITDIALSAGFDNAESFSRAFRQLHGEAPSQFRAAPQWREWQTQPLIRAGTDLMHYPVELIDFPSTRVAAVEYQGPPQHMLSASAKLIAWRRRNGVSPGQGQTFALFYDDPESVIEAQFRFVVGVSFEGEVTPNPEGVRSKLIAGGRCARVRHHGSREHIPAADFLYRMWLPDSGERLRDHPLMMHLVNVGPDLNPAQMITDVYLPLR